MTLQNISRADFCDVVSLLPGSPTNKGKQNIWCCAKKANRPWEIKESFLAFWLSLLLSPLGERQFLRENGNFKIQSVYRSTTTTLNVEKKRKKKHTNSIAGIRARASPPAVSFACLKLYHASKETKNKIPPISEYYVTITRPTVWKRNTSHVVSNVNKGNKREVNRANIFAKKIKAEVSQWPFKTSQGPTFVM